MPSRKDSDIDKDDEIGTRWALLVAGSKGYDNYRHQSDVCHAYQILKKGGLKDENIVVMMYDDIANNEMNPRPGIIINHPQGQDVYAGVPKDYTGKNVTAENFFAVLLGDKKAVKGGSGKVIDSKPNDHIFLYYADHGGSGVLAMPNLPHVYGRDLIDVLKKKHASGTYKEMVIYVEACESGSIFDGVMPENLSIYVTTASKPDENSYGIYCPGYDPPPPPEYQTCLGDLYSISWMEDSEIQNLKKETVEGQYEVVKRRTSNNGTYLLGSHVMEFGDETIRAEPLYLYQGSNPANEGITRNKLSENSFMGVVDQRDAELLFLWKRYAQAKNRGGTETELLKEITKTITYRNHLDNSVKLIGQVLYGPEVSAPIISAVRPLGQPLVDDLGCLKSMVRVFESECGSLTQYGLKHMRAFANICNSGISDNAMKVASKAVCNRENMEMRGPWKGYSA